MEKVFKGYPLDEQESAGGVVNDTVSGRPVVAVYNSDAQTGMAYLDEVDGQTRAFSFSCLVGKAHHVESFAEMGIVAA